MATQIIPFLQKGREVVAYIEGLDVKRIAEVAGLPVEKVEAQLHVLTREDMRPGEIQKNGKAVATDGAWLAKVRDNALLVFDEAQTWWPNRMRATEALTQFVSEHRHRGIDILLLGQSLLDLSALWRRRVDQKFTFLKLTALGSTKRYRVTIWKGQGNDEFVKVGDKLGKYDPKYFGTYSSHVSQDTNTETYTDSRANFLKSYARWAVPVVLVLVVGGGLKAWSFFHPAPVPPARTEPAAPTSGSAPQVAAVPVAAKAKSPQASYFEYLSAEGRVRLAGVMFDSKRERVTGVVEWLDGNTRVIERLSFDQLTSMGVAVRYLGGVAGGAVELRRGDWGALATAWPVEAQGAVSAYRQETIRPAANAGLPASQAAPVVVTADAPSSLVRGGPAQPAAVVARSSASWSDRQEARNAAVRPQLSTR